MKVSLVALGLCVVMTLLNTTLGEEWHKSNERLRDLQTFSKTHATVPDGIKDARKHHNKYITILRDRLKASTDLKISKLEFTGSSFEGVNVGHLPEFDVMVILDGKDVQMEELPDQQGYALLKPKPGTETSLQFDHITESGYISAQKLADVFYGKVQRVVNDTPDLKKVFKLRKHGTVATMLDVKREDGQRFYEVDLVPSFYLPDKHQWYVPKPEPDPQNEEGGAVDKNGRSIWRRSFSLQEKETFDSMDFNNNCRKQALRILKTFREKDSTLKSITSYHLKTLLLELNKDKSRTWNSEELLLRVMELMENLEQALEKGQLPNHYVNKINLLKNMKPIVMENLQKRIHALRTDEIKFSKFIKAFGLSKLVRQRSHTEL